MTTTTMIELDPSEEISAPRFRVVCPVCDETRTVRVSVLWHSALVASQAERAVEQRFVALEKDLPESRCAQCIFLYGSQGQP